MFITTKSKTYSFYGHDIGDDVVLQKAARVAAYLKAHAFKGTGTSRFTGKVGDEEITLHVFQGLHKTLGRTLTIFTHVMVEVG